MKSSPSTYGSRLFILTVFFLLFLASASRLSNPTMRPETFSRNPRSHRHHHSCASISHEKPRSLCFQIQRLHQYRSLPPPSPSQQLHEIDPRYGMEKRLVPSGPNPLHN
ncbi:CLAVATA3/ESR (CLE)-related protein 10-like [Alnus glutinosa]|uniref:CLAVATA3/ESR (CLE)-related protein 10-like n=1 Tax=Alnus glutinosa TaxID=3517 RepID=UPI002D7716F0|nr:CLAVATA3/ESR (CLE)-related protein 10-like [Alnus glutinosa]